tara:strand:- start:370 stop:510 length:141 start_codon:yes stop_codon:yes gene_type:complete
VLIGALLVAGLEKDVADGLQLRADALQNHMAHHYRRLSASTARAGS